MKAGSVFEEYVAKIDRAYRTGKATEYTYRGALTDLIAALLPGTVMLNEPKRIACGAPDLIITRAKLPVAFIEAKDIGESDLDGRKVTGNKEQFDRYKSSLDHIAFTEYLDFHFYEKETLIESVRIADVMGDGVKTLPENFERFAALVTDLGNAAPQKIKSATQLAKLMAGKTRLLEQATMNLLEGKDAAKTSIGRLMDDFKRTLVPDVDAKEFADIYAQTITYGMFAARLHDDTPEDFTPWIFRGEFGIISGVGKHQERRRFDARQPSWETDQPRWFRGKPRMCFARVRGKSDIRSWRLAQGVGKCVWSGN